MASVTFSASVGGDNSTVSDDSNAATTLANYGYSTRLVPAFGQVIAVANFVNTKAANIATSETNAATSAATALNAPGTSATSSSTIAVGSGSKSLTLAQSGKAFAVGQTVVIADNSAPAVNYMAGIITAFTSGSGAMTVSVSNFAGSGSPTSWTISLGALAVAGLPPQTGNAGKFLTTDGANASWSVSALAVGQGGTGATTASAARTNLNLVIGTDVQAYDAGLLSIAGLTTAADKMIYTTASDTYAVTPLTGFGRSLIDDVDAAAARSTLGLVIGSVGGVQAYDAELAAIAGLTSAADRLPYFTGAGTASLANFTSFGRSLVDDADAAAGRATLGAAASGANADITALNGLTALIAGRSFSNLQGNRPTGTTLSYSADLIVVQSGTLSRALTSFSATLDATVTGIVNGRNASISSLNSAGWLFVHAIWNGTTAGLWLDSSATAPTLPSGYTHTRRVGAGYFDSSGTCYAFTQRNAHVQFNSPFQIAGGGAAGSTVTPTWIAGAHFAPSTAASALVGLQLTSNSNQAMAAPNNSYGACNATSNPPPLSIAATLSVNQAEMLIESPYVYYAFSGGNGYLRAYGYRDNL